LEEIAPDWGKLKFETIKFGHEFLGTRTRERLRWRGPAVTIKYRSVLSSERRHIITNPQLSKDNSREKNRKIGHGPHMKT
jgi:hypothetical protein